MGNKMVSIFLEAGIFAKNPSESNTEIRVLEKHYIQSFIFYFFDLFFIQSSTIPFLFLFQEPPNFYVSYQ